MVLVVENHPGFLWKCICYTQGLKRRKYVEFTNSDEIQTHLFYFLKVNSILFPILFPSSYPTFQE